MLHDRLIFGPGRRAADAERRRSARTAVRAELVVRWHHDPGTAVRYAVLDLGDGGARIRSTTPLLRGMSGTAVKLLPTGVILHRLCTVWWSRPADADGAFEIGLRFAGDPSA
jgi:hypothetical protein